MSDQHNYLPLSLKVGDRIRALSNTYADHLKGTLGTIVKVYSQGEGIYAVKFDNGVSKSSWYVLGNEYARVEIEKITKEELKKADPYRTMDDLLSFLHERMNGGIDGHGHH